MLIVKALAIWLVMVMAAIANGIFREFVLDSHIGAPYSLPISGAILSVLIAMIIYASISVFGARSNSFYWLLGIFWVMLTVTLEYGFGYFLRGMTLDEINQVFNVSDGNLFALALAVTFFSPKIFSCFIKN
jgi:hypothetical protein